MERVDFKLEFYRDLTDWLAERRQEGRGIILVGDLNTARDEIDLARPDTNRTTSGFMPIEREALERIFDLGFVDRLGQWLERGGLGARGDGLLPRRRIPDGLPAGPAPP